ncbi:DUF4910 domain-containing protein [Sphingomicrobium aestuariivivum]|uniref:DUF4910 domain-containing protein n=1 Tax=Sphingomicrobium aestuariivivum TaxID=1582356 RepID=UPI001FD66F17|nr:DUF4910 domain-containing protein [Sphingomicrobium aestuariivivum]MCJ8190778.1 DUF4910 domain-containing protein [Sphingomicrobium aestuariivivum]
MAANLETLFERLFPICRSITGPGIRRSMEILAEHMPLEVHGVPSGEKVLDWTVPPEWELRRARLWGPDGSLVLDSDGNNLHVLNFSTPFSGEMDLEELDRHLFSEPALPDAIPYVTSYYNRRWGLCLSHHQREALVPGTYRVEIDTEIRDGLLNYATAELPGESDEVVLLSTYLCHPSLANNELSGPLAMVRLYEALEAMEQRRYTYRFLVIPETIGSITYLAREGAELLPRMAAGMVLTCLGGPSETVSFKLSRRDWTGRPSTIDRLARHFAGTLPGYAVRDFSPMGGSDERQYCSPGFDMPVVQAARTVYGQYPGYHNSHDDLDFMTIAAVEDSAARLATFIAAFEEAGREYVNRSPHGEPQLGRRDLYPSLNSPMSRILSSDDQFDGRRMLNQLLGLLSLADGEHDLLAIAERIDFPVTELAPLARHLREHDLLELKSS